MRKDHINAVFHSERLEGVNQLRKKRVVDVRNDESEQARTSHP